MWEFASADLWNFRLDRLGRYWGSLCGEVDILALDTNEKNMIIGECKYSESEKGLGVLHDLQSKADILSKHTQSASTKYVIFSKSGFTKGLIDEAQSNPDLTLVTGLSKH